MCLFLGTVDVVKDSPQEGDMVQYLDDKGEPFHMNMVVGKGKDGKSLKVFNAYNQKIGNSAIYDQQIDENGCKPTELQS